MTTSGELAKRVIGLQKEYKPLLEQRRRQSETSFEHVPPEVLSEFYAFYESLGDKIDEEAERPFTALSDDELEQLDKWVQRLERYG